MTENEDTLGKLKSLLLRGDRDLIIPLINRELMKDMSRLSCHPCIDHFGFDVNPVTRPECGLYGVTYPLGEPLCIDELMIFKDQFSHLICGPGSEELWLMFNRLPSYIVGLRAIKYALGGAMFRGIRPCPNELGFGHIRPQFFRSSNGGYRTDWRFTATKPNTWEPWFSFILGKEFGLIITHQKQYNLKRGKHASIVPIPTILALPGQRVNALVMLDTKGPTKLVPGGLVIGLAGVLAEETPTWAEEDGK